MIMNIVAIIRARISGHSFSPARESIGRSKKTMFGLIALLGVVMVSNCYASSWSEVYAELDICNASLANNPPPGQSCGCYLKDTSNNGITSVEVRKKCTNGDAVKSTSQSLYPGDYQIYCGVGCTFLACQCDYSNTLITFSAYIATANLYSPKIVNITTHCDGRKEQSSQILDNGLFAAQTSCVCTNDHSSNCQATSDDLHKYFPCVCMVDDGCCCSKNPCCGKPQCCDAPAGNSGL